MADDGLDYLDLSEKDFFDAADHDINQGLDDLAKDVRDYMKSETPSDSGEARESIEIFEIEDKAGHPARRVEMMVRYAHILEYGSEDTDEVGMRAKTAAHFHNEDKYTI